VPNGAAGTACMDLRCVLPPLDMPGCFGRRKCADAHRKWLWRKFGDAGVVRVAAGACRV